MYRTMAKVLAVLLALTLLVSACAPTATPTPQPKPTEAKPTAVPPTQVPVGEKKTIGITLFTRAHQFYQDMEKTWKENADKYNFELLIQNAEVDVASRRRSSNLPNRKLYPAKSRCHDRLRRGPTGHHPRHRSR